MTVWWNGSFGNQKFDKNDDCVILVLSIRAAMSIIVMNYYDF